MWASTQKAHDLFQSLTAVLDLDETRLRVASPDIGGGFGPKLCVYSEDVAVVAAAAKLLRRSIKWIEDRREHFTNAVQERDQHWSLEIAVDGQARVLGVRGRILHDQGAYTLQDPNIPYNSASTLTGPYMVPALDVEVTIALTNKTPVSSVRGAGYPQAAFAMERMMDRVARELALDRAELRRRNLIPAGQAALHQAAQGALRHDGRLRQRRLPGLPGGRCSQRPAGTTSRAGRPPRAPKAAISASASRTASKAPVAGRSSRASCASRPRVASSVYTGACAMGQGLRTALAQICASELGLRAEDINVVPGDTVQGLARARRVREPPDGHRGLIGAARVEGGGRQGAQGREPSAGSRRA